jgi:ATP-dependent exoDNAse (exonuclease V) alpha subunit
MGVSKKDIKIITPTLEDVNEINDLIQDRITFESLLLDKYVKDKVSNKFGSCFARGDEVMCIGNRSIGNRSIGKLNICHGMMGSVQSVILDKGIMVNFHGEKSDIFVPIKSEEKNSISLNDLKLSFAIRTVESIGCEWSYVIIYHNDRGYNNRNYLYTAVSRSKLFVALIDDKIGTIESIMDRPISK